jgi:hypothetical protein
MTNKLMLIGLLSLIFNLIGYVPYYRDIFRGKVKPQRITWSLWAVLTFIASVNQIRNGGGWSTVFVLSTFLLVFGVFILSFTKGIGGGSTQDKLSLVVAGLLFIWWIYSKDSVYSTYIVIAIDSIGALLTAQKAYKEPETEAYLQWFTSGISAMLGILAIEGYSIILLAYPLYVVIGNSVIVSAKYIGSKKGAKHNER